MTRWKLHVVGLGLKLLMTDPFADFGIACDSEDADPALRRGKRRRLAHLEQATRARVESSHNVFPLKRKQETIKCPTLRTLVGAT